ncbi:outer membrane beta-barrel protein [Aliidiomarina maris]|uniref:Opacity protein-like surface antigen n=1 Tax=Aliidiomarina maris TaxID=531312 RepID=A0A327X349_9GAMM|nr:outer membrane beta-barrel protein [Aliidiomarina maris]RAJ99062.1 opacity protein-like surface antigen [Aliidiomarina maris]RUO27774.1 hypothetical protein CWE07_03960 [Aliidiomarina maris]
MKNHSSLIQWVTVGGLVTAFASFPSLAASPSLNYFGVHYQELQADNQVDFDGISFEVSGRLRDQWLLSGSYAQVEGPRIAGHGNLDWDITYARLGYIAHQQDRFVSYIGPQVHYLSFEVPTSSNTDSETGFGAFAGARYMLTPRVELQGEISYSNLSHANSSYFLQYQVGFRAYVSNRFALEARAQLGDWDGFMLGGSVHF